MYIPIHAESCLRFVEIRDNHYHMTTLTIQEAENFLQELQEAIDDARHKDKLLNDLAKRKNLK